MPRRGAVEQLKRGRERRASMMNKCIKGCDPASMTNTCATLKRRATPLWTAMAVLAGALKAFTCVLCPPLTPI